MTNSLLGTEYRFDKESGYILHAQHQRIAEIIHDYNPELELVWIPPDRRDAEDTKPFAVIHRQRDGQQYPVFFIAEDEMDHRVLGRIFAADMRKHNPNNVIREIEAYENAQRILEAKAYEEKKAEALDLAKHVLKSKLHKYRHDGKVFE